MPRRRGVDVAGVRDVPPELLDLDAPAWGSSSKTLAWMDALGLAKGVHVHVTRLGDGPATRHKVATCAWAISKGLVNTSGYPQIAKLIAMGIPAHGGDVSAERFAAAGVSIEGN